MQKVKTLIDMTKKQAHSYLYSLWENGEVPSNFTEDHSHYSTAIDFVVKNNYLDKSLFFSKF